MNEKHPFIKKGMEYDLTLLTYDKYELECYIFRKNNNGPSLFIRNLKTNSYHLGGYFYYYGWSIEDIKEDLIPTIAEVIERNWGNEVLGNNFTLISAVIYPHITYFTSNNQLDEGIKKAQQNENEYLDTKTFKAISLLWLEFLESKLSQ